MICIFHKDCVDGFAAAWAVWTRHGDTCTYYPGVYGVPPPDVKGHDVVLVDFSYDLEICEKIAAEAKSLTILDHHPTALDKIGEFVAQGHGVIDLEHSGAVLAWGWANPGAPVPKILYYVEDYDLWHFAIPETKYMQAVLASYPYDFNIYNRLAKTMATDSGDQMIRMEGEGILRQRRKDAEEMIANGKRTMRIGGYDVPAINASGASMTNEIGSLLYDDPQVPFVAIYSDRSDGKRKFSLRSSKKSHGVDVRRIAEFYKGGGHPLAASFIMPQGWEGEAVSSDMIL